MHALRGYVDLQVNGYADIDFNADRLAAEDVLRVCQRLRDDGVAGILATVITAEVAIAVAAQAAKTIGASTMRTVPARGWSRAWRHIRLDDGLLSAWARKSAPGAPGRRDRAGKIF